MILTIRNNQLPHRYLRPGTTVRKKNHMQCQKSFTGFPKMQYYDFYIQLGRVTKHIKTLNDFWLEGKAIIQIENGTSSQSGCFYQYNVDLLDWESERNLDIRLKRIQREIRNFTQLFTHGYKVTFKLHQWLLSVEKKGSWEHFGDDTSVPNINSSRTLL